MDRDQLLEQAQEVVEAHPDLCLVPGDDGVVLSGKYILDGIYNGVPYYEEFNLEIRIPWGYPEKLPSVKELDNRIKKSKYGHIFVGDELCLGARCDLIDRLQACNSLLEYLDMVISSYLFGFLYYEEYGVEPPFGERSHGFKGLREAYKERYGVVEDKSLYGLLFLLGDPSPLRGHIMCPCGSGRRLRDCHGPALSRDRESVYFSHYLLEATEIIRCALKEMEEQSEAKRRLQAAVRSGNLL